MKLFVLIIIIISVTCIPTLAYQNGEDETRDLVHLYHNKLRLKRQGDRFNNGFGNRFDDEDDWFVFDEVEDDRQPIEPPARPTARSFNRPEPPRPIMLEPKTTQRPTLPNAGGPRPGQCEENCNARTTTEYNPVCGDNGMTYYNNARIECARYCGSSVRTVRGGRCGPLLPF